MVAVVGAPLIGATAIYIDALIWGWEAVYLNVVHMNLKLGGCSCIPRIKHLSPVPYIDIVVILESGASSSPIPVNEGHVYILTDIGDKHEITVIELVDRRRGPPWPIAATPCGC